jgi:hypothetical protein
VNTPAGLEEMFAARDRYLTGFDGAPDIEVILELNRRYGVRPVEGPPLI